MIPLQFALRRKMMMAGGGGGGEAPISDLPLGTLINVGTDGGDGAANYEIADIDNLVSGGVVLVRKDIYSKSKFSDGALYPSDTLDNLIKTTIYNQMPQNLRDKMMDVTFNLSGPGNITRKMFALTLTMTGFGNNSGVAEGKALQLYTSNASRIKTFYGSAASWWLSSGERYGYPVLAMSICEDGYANDSHDSGYELRAAPPIFRAPSYDRAWTVLEDGSDGLNAVYYAYGVVPAFVIPSETPYNATPNTDGSYNLIL